MLMLAFFTVRLAQISLSWCWWVVWSWRDVVRLYAPSRRRRMAGLW